MVVAIAVMVVVMVVIIMMPMIVVAMVVMLMLVAIMIMAVIVLAVVVRHPDLPEARFRTRDGGTSMRRLVPSGPLEPFYSVNTHGFGADRYKSGRVDQCAEWQAVERIESAGTNCIEGPEQRRGVD
jgi:hypothetical protein